MPYTQPKRWQLWLAVGSRVRLRPEHRNHVGHTTSLKTARHEGMKYRMLNVIDELTREVLAIRVKTKLNSLNLIDVLSEQFLSRGLPGDIRSLNGPKFGAEAVRKWIAAVGAKTAYIEPGSPWENDYVGSFNARLRDELLKGVIFYSLR